MVYYSSRCHCVVTYLLNIASLHAQRLLFFEENNIRRLNHSKIVIHCSIRKSTGNTICPILRNTSYIFCVENMEIVIPICYNFNKSNDIVSNHPTKW